MTDPTHDNATAGLVEPAPCAWLYTHSRDTWDDDGFIVATHDVECVAYKEPSRDFRPNRNIRPVYSADAITTLEAATARADKAEAELAGANKRAERLHRRAQAVEGKMSRTARFLNSVISYAETRGSDGFWLGQYLRAAQRHARQGSGMSVGLTYSLWRRMEEKLTAERDAALSRVTEAKAEGMRLRDALTDLTSWFDGGPSSYGPWIIKAGEYGADDAVAAACAALAQSGGADPAQGGDALTTALAYLVNAQHDLRMGSDPVRALATLSAGVAAVEKFMENSYA